MEILPLESKGLVVESPTSGFKLMAVTLDNMRSDEILVEMEYSGICHTDVAGGAGGYSNLDFPAVLGHEGAGIIRAIGPDVRDKSLNIGDSVILSFNHCGNCRNCMNSHPSTCTHFETLNVTGKRLDEPKKAAKLADGTPLVSQFFGQSSFLKFSIVSQHSVVRCPYPEDLATYAALGCGFQTGAGTILNALKPSPDESILIFGAGSVGIAALMAAKYLNLRQIIVVDIVPQKLELARELGATHTLNPNGVNIVKEILAVSDGGVNFIVECTGVSSVIDSMLDCLCCGGTAGVVGLPKLGFRLQIDPTKLLHESKTLRGICQGDSIAKKFIPEMIEMHRSGHFPLEKLCKFYDVKDYEQALTDVREGKIIKPILRWD